MMESADVPLGLATTVTGDVTHAAVAPATPRLEGFRLVRLIGSGGMGDVWEAEQEHPLRRTVAIKFVKAGMSSNEFIMRFESERQSLALMDHPNVTRVFEAGATGQGQPYFVMEF